MCPVCKGRGEVNAGVVTRVSRRPNPDSDRGPEDWLTSAEKMEYNPAARNEDGHIWYLVQNPYGPFYSIAVCGKCRGTGANE